MNNDFKYTKIIATFCYYFLEIIIVRAIIHLGFLYNSAIFPHKVEYHSEFQYQNVKIFLFQGVLLLNLKQFSTNCLYFDEVTPLQILSPP